MNGFNDKSFKLLGNKRHLVILPELRYFMFNIPY